MEVARPAAAAAAAAAAVVWAAAAVRAVRVVWAPGHRPQPARPPSPGSAPAGRARSPA